MTNEQLAVFVVAIAALVLVTVALSVVACEWRDRKRQAAEAAAVARALKATHLREQEKLDRFVQSMTPEQREKWEKRLQVLIPSSASNASAPNREQNPRDTGEQVPMLQIG